jgi:hypothetical protein
MVNTFTITQQNYKKTIYWYPESNGHNNDFTKTSGSNNYEMVDDLKNIRYSTVDWTFNYCSNTTGEDFYGINTVDPPSLTGTINYIRVHTRVKVDDISENKPNVKISITDNAGTNQYYSNNLFSVSAFANFSYAWSENPRTGITWEWSDIANLETGIFYGDEQTNIKNLDLGGTQLIDDVQFRRVWCDNTYVYSVSEDSGLKAHTYPSLGVLNSIDNGGTYYDVWSDGTYIYTACGNSGLRAYSFNGISFTLLDTIDDGGTYYGVYGDGTYIYASCGHSGLRAYSFNGSSFSLLSTTPRLGSSDYEYTEIVADNDYIYVISLNGVFAYSFNGSSFTFLDSITGLSASSICRGNENHIFIGIDESIFAYSFDGSTLTLLGTYDFTPTTEMVFDLFSNNDYLYVSKEDDGLYVFYFDGQNFFLLKSHEVIGIYRGIWCDEDYVFIAITGSFEGMRYYETLKNISISQQYVEINYNETQTASIPKPDALSSSSEMNIKMLNFWNGDREVYSLDRASRSIVLFGIDWQSNACTNIQKIRDMGRNGEDVIISGLNLYILNSTFKIRSFGWEQISKNPIRYDWIIELEFKT